MSRLSPGRSRPDASVAVDRPSVPAEIVFLCVVLVLTIFFSLAGVPGLPEPVAGEGSDKLRQGWMEEARQAADSEGMAEAGAEAALPAGAEIRGDAAPATDADGQAEGGGRRLKARRPKPDGDR